MKLFQVKMEVVLIVGIFIFGCAGMRSGSWKSFISTDLYEGFYYVIRSHLLYKGTLEVAVKLEYTEKGIAERIREFGKGYKNVGYSLQSWEVDCPARNERILSSDQFSAEGNLVNTELPERSLSRSLGRSLYEAACN
jgi:hypothetical protein